MSVQTLEIFDQSKDGIRSRTKTVTSEVKDYLDEILLQITHHHAVQHPFLKWYKDNKLSAEQEKLLFSECYYFFRYLPFYITGMAVKTRDENILKEIVLNVYDEVGHPTTHSEIYLKFLKNIQISEEEVLSYKPLVVTHELNDGIRKLYTESPIIKSLGALYADETMSSFMVSNLMYGLKNQGYPEETLHFWQLHIDVEVGHSNSVFNAIAPYVESKDNREQFEAGVNKFLTLLDNYWNGITELLTVDIKH